MYLYCILIRLTRLLFIYSFSITLLFCYSTAFSAFHYAIFIQRCNAFLYHSVLFAVPFLPLSSSLRQNVCYNHVLPLPLFACIFISMYAYKIIYVLMYAFLFYAYIYLLLFHIWGKTRNLCPFEAGLLCLTWWSPVPSIYLQMTQFHFIYISIILQFWTECWALYRV
jgi:hypothetical protein